MTPRRALLLVPVLGAALAGCAFFAPPPEGPDRRTRVAIDEALLHALAREAEARPSVACVDVTMAKAGNPYTLPGDPVVDVDATTTGDAARDALTRELGEQVWDARLTELSTLTLTVVAPDGASTLGEVLGGEPGSASAAQMQEAFGPRPDATLTTPPPDPGDPECP